MDYASAFYKWAALCQLPLRALRNRRDLPADQRSVRYADKKVYHSGKHSFYGYKVELSVLPNGFAINCTKHYKGSVSDKTIFDENLDFHMASLTKQANEDRIDDPDHATRQWAVLADKGYQGIQRDLRAVIPIKKPAGESSRWTTYVPTTA
ncbi:hypothetical protein DYB35_009333 [Aphanomyces astaci]|uniref:DDE Tnp4 domain-containing protein n=1 Tax=Aphanomyces astaci TaxID=112090 RepID=A0A397DY61_APHAT|nr:hypothetical protein DYB30_014228 [Aphanomyces astaci]RHY83435.1 hypothetical protein DYB35_009333 [Aphanomyces astaci]RHZ13489.1 hypothetical protein DYB31_007799 [Aphanomyces astaci]RHZ15945.1 hypothetical protein DYB26_003587 [Aphanomyces astaci]